MKLPKIFQGVGGDALTGIAAAAAVGANPLLGLLATPYLKTRREGVEADTAGQLLENQGMQRRLDMLDALPGIFSAQQSTGVMAPGAKEGEAMRVAGTLPSLAPYLLRSKDARPTDQERYAALSGLTGPDGQPLLSTDQIVQTLTGVDPALGLQIKQMELTLEQMIDKIRSERSDMEQVERERQYAMNAKRDNLISMADIALSGAKNNYDLVGTIMEPGSITAGLPRWAQQMWGLGADFFGFEDEAVKTSMALRSQDMLKKDIQDLNLAVINSVGSTTQGWRDAIERGLAQVGIDPLANQKILERLYERGIREAAGQGVDAPEEVLAGLEELKGYRAKLEERIANPRFENPLEGVVDSAWSKAKAAGATGEELVVAGIQDARAMAGRVMELRDAALSATGEQAVELRAEAMTMYQKAYGAVASAMSQAPDFEDLTDAEKQELIRLSLEKMGLVSDGKRGGTRGRGAR